MEFQNKETDFSFPREDVRETDLSFGYMKKAIELAKKAGESGDVPIGAVLVYDGLKPESPMGILCKEKGIFPGEILGTGYNQRNLLGKRESMPFYNRRCSFGYTCTEHCIFLPCAWSEISFD